MKQQPTKLEYIKLAGMLLAIILCILYFDIIDLLENTNDSPAILYLSIGMVYSYLIWLSMKRGIFKKRIFWIFSVAYWVFVFYIFISRFKFYFDDIWYYYHSFGIAVAMILMFPLSIAVYWVGMKKKQKKKKDEEITVI